MQVSIAISPWMLFAWPTSDNFPLTRRGVDRFQVFKNTVKDQKWFWSAKLELKALKNISEMVSWWHFAECIMEWLNEAMTEWQR